MLKPSSSPPAPPLCFKLRPGLRKRPNWKGNYFRIPSLVPVKLTQWDPAAFLSSVVMTFVVSGDGLFRFQQLFDGTTPSKSIRIASDTKQAGKTPKSSPVLSLWRSPQFHLSRLLHLGELYNCVLHIYI